MSSTPAPGEILCPDPSAHGHGKKASDSASRAALLATGAERKSTSNDDIFTDDGKLSSRSAAQNIKYANAKDLPSFPSTGATSGAAFAAATLAKDHKMKELWQPETSSAGMKAATKAQREGGHLDLWEPSASSAGNSAAVLAMRTKGLSPEIDRGYTDTGRSNSLAAAAMSANAGRQRAGSLPAITPPQYPDSQNSSKNALNAAVVSHRTNPGMAPDGWNSEANQAARIKNLGGRMDPSMFGEHPPVEPELEEQRHQAALRASAVSMAKSMYEHQNRAVTPMDTTGGTGAEVAHRRNQSSMSQPDLKEEAMRYIHLQDAAHKIAQERLAKLDKEMAETRYREYYGYGDASPKKSRLTSIRRRPRAASEGEDLSDSDDERQARRIRSQMTQLSSARDTVDVKQRNQDRAKLMAAAEKRVHARMHDMDEKVFAETGKVSQSMMDEWEAKARVKAEQQKAERDRAAPTGKVAIGGGKFMDQAEIEAIAAARLKPTLAEIDDTAAKMRARDAELKRQEDLNETAAMEQKMKESQQKAEFKRVKEQDKIAARREKQEREQREEAARMEQRMKEQQQKDEWRKIKEQDKANARREKEERKAAERREKEEARARRSEDKRKSREADREAVSAAAAGTALGEAADNVKEERELEETRQVEGEVAAGNALEEIAEKLRKDREMKEEEHRESVGMAGVAVGEIAGKVKVDRELEEKRKSKERRRSSAAAAAGGATLAEVAEKIKRDREIEEQREAEVGEFQGSPVVAVGAAGVAGVGGVAAYEVLQEQENEPAPSTDGPHKSTIANFLDPRVSPDEDKQMAAVERSETGPAPNTIGRHESDLANIVDPRVQPNPGLQKARTTNPETGPAPNTIGPHSNDLLNIIDPRVQPDPQLQKSEQVTEGPHSTDMANIVDPRVDSTPKSESDVQRDTGIALAGGAAVAAPTDKGIEEQVGTTREDPKRKSSSRGMFGKIADKFKRREEDKRTPEPAKAKQEDEGAKVLAAPALGGSLSESMGMEEASATKDREVTRTEAIKEEEVGDDQDIDRSRTAEALIGVTAVGGFGAATAATVISSEQEQKAESEVSSLSTEDEHEDEQLEQYTTTAEHSGHHNFASPPAEEGRNQQQKRIALERHISTIDTSSESSDDDEELEDTDDERGRAAPVPETREPPAVHDEEEGQGLFKTEWGAYERAGKGGTATEGELESRFATYDLNDPNPESTEQMKEAIRRVEEEKVEYYGQTPEQPPKEKEKEGLLQKVMSPFSHKDESKDTTTTETQGESSTVRTAPSEDEPSAAGSQKERKGIKGIFSKLTGKPENKLTKRSQDDPTTTTESAQSESAFVGGARLSGSEEKEGVVTPVTTTSTSVVGPAGQIDPTVEETSAITGASSSAREGSPSSFERHGEDLGDLDDVSSSGAEEEEVIRGRAGRLARKIGIAREKGKEKAVDEPMVVPQSATTTGQSGAGEEQFEEARDTFDESLAPPAAFAGRSKNDNQSPARETRFQEQF